MQGNNSDQDRNVIISCLSLCANWLFRFIYNISLQQYKFKRPICICIKMYRQYDLFRVFKYMTKI